MYQQHPLYMIKSKKAGANTKKILPVNASPRKGGILDTAAGTLAADLRDCEVTVFHMWKKGCYPRSGRKQQEKF